MQTMYNTTSLVVFWTLRTCPLCYNIRNTYTQMVSSQGIGWLTFKDVKFKGFQVLQILEKYYCYLFVLELKILFSLMLPDPLFLTRTEGS